jgi:hypothetical protein
MPKSRDKEASIKLTLTEQEFYWLYRLALLELQSKGPGPEYRHGLHLLAEKMTKVGKHLDGTEDYWLEIVGPRSPLPKS